MGHEHHESSAVASVVVGQAESCLLHGIHGSQLDGYAVLGRREQLRAEAPSSLRRGVLVTPVVFPCRPPRSRRTRLSVEEVSFILFLSLIFFLPPSHDTYECEILKQVAPSLSLAPLRMRIERFTSSPCRDTPREKNARIYDR